MRGDRATRDRIEAAACFAIGVAAAVAGSLGVQAIDGRSGGPAASAAAPAVAAAPVAEVAPAAAPAAAVADDVASLEPVPLPAPYYAAIAAPAALTEPGARLGRFRFTRYYVVDENRFPEIAAAEEAVTIYDDRACAPIAAVSHAFVGQLDMEGTGRLRDGRTINVSDEECRCGRSPCYRATGGDARWGVGARGEPLEPFRTVAVDPGVVALGTWLYLPELDGLTMPGPAPWGGFVHDGCVVAIDVGGRIHGRDLDFFVGSHVHMKAFDARRNIERVTVHRGGERCARPGTATRATAEF